MLVSIKCVLQLAVWGYANKINEIGLVHNMADAGTMNVKSVMSVVRVAEKNLYVPGQNAILNIQIFDNLIGWMLDTAMLTTLNRNQSYSSITLMTHATQHRCPRHIVNQAL